MKVYIKGVFTFIILLIGLRAYSQQNITSKEFKREFLEDINHARQKGCNCGGNFMPPAPPLVWNDQLSTAAAAHARDMADNNYFSHTSKDGRSVQDRIVYAGYNYKGFSSYAIGENIAQGQLSIAEVMQGWLKSPGHCRNLLNPSFKEVGIALYNGYWVQDFGGRVAFSAEEQKMIKSGKYRLIEKE